MIKKYLVCGKNIFLQGKNMESYKDLGKVVEVNFPLERYWEAEKLLKDLNFMVASGEAASEILAATKKLLLFCAPYGAMEKDRNWLYEKANE